MVLDPISALSVAAAVVQFVDFSRELVCKSKELFGSARGATEENLGIQTVTLRLQQLADRITKSAKKSSSACAAVQDSPRLRQICAECDDISKRLLEKLYELKVPEDTTWRRWKSFRQALKSVWSKTEIDNMSKKLAALRSELDTEVLICMKESLSQMSLDDKTYFTELDKQSQKIIQTVLDSKSSTEEAFLQRFQTMEDQYKDQFVKLGSISIQQDRVLQSMEDQTIRIINTLLRQAAKNIEVEDHFHALHSRLDRLDTQLEQRLRQHRQDLVYEDGQKRRSRVQLSILESLRFPQMKDRYEAIAKAHAKTFTWIFRDPKKLQKPWDSFTDWLSAGSGVYWIQGKPASGKSTLMRFIWRHSAIMKHLEAWSERSQLITASFYFWSSGFEQQRSQAGLFRSLLYKTLNDQPNLTAKVFPEEWEDMSRLAANDIIKIEPEKWNSLGQLQGAFTRLVQLAGPHLRICFFIDGLDEYEGDPADIAEYVHEVSSISPYAKFCVSSRPWPVFISIFEDSPGLKLQDLTEKDIRKFTRDKFASDRNMKKLVKHEPENARWLVREITRRASGVFLWVHLVVKSLISGLRNGDDMTSLHRRLCSLPVDMENLYAHILDQIEPQNKEESSKIFQIFRTNGNHIDLMTLRRTLTYSNYRDVLRLPTLPLQGPAEKGDAERSSRLYEMTILRLNSRCRGLLEVGQTAEEDAVTLNDDGSGVWNEQESGPPDIAPTTQRFSAFPERRCSLEHVEGLLASQSSSAAEEPLAFPLMSPVEERLYHKPVDEPIRENLESRGFESSKLIAAEHNIKNQQGDHHPYDNGHELWSTDSDDEPETVHSAKTIVPDSDRQRTAMGRQRTVSPSDGGGIVVEKPQQVRYLHRTARDFLEQQHVWQRILDETSRTSFDPTLSLVMGIVIQLKQLHGLFNEARSLDLIRQVTNLRVKPCETAVDLLSEFHRVLNMRWSEAGIQELDANDPILFDYVQHTDSEDKVTSRAMRCGPHWYSSGKGLFLPFNPSDSSTSRPEGFAWQPTSPPLLVYALSFHSLPPLLLPMKPIVPNKASEQKPSQTVLGDQFIPHVGLVEYLLNHGFHPNQSLDTFTIWEYTIFLVHLHSSLSPDHLAPWVQVFKLMLDHGADPHACCMQHEDIFLQGTGNTTIYDYHRAIQAHADIPKEPGMVRRRRGVDEDRWDADNPHAYYHSVTAVVNDVFTLSGVPGTEELFTLLKHKKDRRGAYYERVRDGGLPEDNGPKRPRWVS